MKNLAFSIGTLICTSAAYASVIIAVSKDVAGENPWWWGLSALVLAFAGMTCFEKLWREE